jgi:hypothetical protein
MDYDLYWTFTGTITGRTRITAPEGDDRAMRAATSEALLAVASNPTNGHVINVVGHADTTSIVPAGNPWRAP